VTVFLVRHGRPLVDRERPAHEWELDPARYDDIWALRTSGRLPTAAAWYSSPEPKALATAELLTDGEVGVVDALREQVRRSAEWVDDFSDAVRRAFAVPDAVAVPGWEPLARCRDRVCAAVDAILAAHGDEDLVLVGHGTAWTLVVAQLTAARPDLDLWRALAMPDLLAIRRPEGAASSWLMQPRLGESRG
jgi:broad specificity phosphatase PhoE